MVQPQRTAPGLPSPPRHKALQDSNRHSWSRPWTRTDEDGGSTLGKGPRPTPCTISVTGGRALSERNKPHFHASPPAAPFAVDTAPALIKCAVVGKTLSLSQEGTQAFIS